LQREISAAAFARPIEIIDTLPEAVGVRFYRLITESP
jgi:hypothetical protein